jgi:hypothetical protein
VLFKRFSCPVAFLAIVLVFQFSGENRPQGAYAEDYSGSGYDAFAFDGATPTATATPMMNYNSGGGFGIDAFDLNDETIDRLEEAAAAEGVDLYTASEEEIQSLLDTLMSSAAVSVGSIGMGGGEPTATPTVGEALSDTPMVTPYPSYDDDQGEDDDDQGEDAEPTPDCMSSGRGCDESSKM